MILYSAQTHDGSGGDFIQLSIVNGFLDFRFDLGSGISPVQSTVKVDDGEWHEVQIRCMMNIIKHISKEPLKCIARVTLLLFAEYDYSILFFPSVVWISLGC